MKIFNVEIKNKIKDDFFKILKDIEQIEKNNILSHSNADDKKCSQCEYLNFCDDRI
jgi:radical SAM protein with 4Fe4S-binding SPASM domain